MNQLIPFDSIHLQKLIIFSDLQFDKNDGSILILKFKIIDDLSEADFSTKSDFIRADYFERRDELWKSTCFEMFLNPVGSAQYFEFNFNLESYWNCYYFESYRFPQPPKQSFDFELQKIKWQSKELEIQIKNNSIFNKFNIGLTAVIMNKKSQITYFALKHETHKPDFHNNSHFILQRG